MAGKIKLAFVDGVPAVQEVTEGQKSITLTAPNDGTFETGKWYYIVAVPGTLSSGYKLTFNTGEEYAVRKSSSSVTIKRGIFGSIEDADENLIFVENGSGDPYYPKEEGVTRLMTYNVGVFWKSKDEPGGLADSSGMIAEMIKEVGADVCAIQEVDSCNTRHNTYQLSNLADKLGWNFWYSSTMPYREGSYGIGVVVPKETGIIDKYSVALPKGAGEPRALSVIETDKYVFASTHMDHSDNTTLINQISVVNDWVQSKYMNYDKPVFLAGDMNTVKSHSAFQNYLSSWEVISNGDDVFLWDKTVHCVDWIFHYKESKSVTVKGSQTMTKFYNGDVTLASDHPPVYVDVVF